MVLVEVLFGMGNGRGGGSGQERECEVKDSAVGIWMVLLLACDARVSVERGVKALVKNSLGHLV